MKLRYKVAAGVATGAAVIGLGSAAFAYWTTGGSGTGSASTGAPTSNLTITAHNASAALVPGGAAADLALDVSNPNVYSVDLQGDTLAITAGSLKCGSTTVDDSWFSLASNGVTSSTTVPAKSGSTNGTATLSPSGVTLQMNDVAADQDVCQNSTVSFSLTVASETGH